MVEWGGEIGPSMRRLWLQYEMTCYRCYTGKARATGMWVDYSIVGRQTAAISGQLIHQAQFDASRLGISEAGLWRKAGAHCPAIFRCLRGAPPGTAVRPATIH